MISIYNSVESPIKDIEILGNTVDGVSVGILQDDGQYKITLFTNNGLDNMSPDYREDKEELLLPCQLEKIGDSTDRLYYDKEEKAWCIYKVGQSKIVLPVTFTIFLNSFYGTTNLYMVSGEVEGTIKAKVSKSLGASVSSLNDKADVLIDKIDAMLGGKVDLDGYATIEYVDVKDDEIKDRLDNMFEEYGEEQISIDFPNASTISIVDNDDLFTSTTIEGALRELANNSGSGNAEGIKFDNSSNEMTSVNVQDAIEENKTSILNIENELSKTENTKYSTENGVKEFECKDGYVDNVVIEGETLVNLALQNTTNTTNPRNRVECNNVMGATEFTVINKSSLTLKVDIFENGEYKRYTEHPSNTSIFVRLEAGEILGAYTFIFTEESNEDTLQEFKTGFVILEGDHTDKHISYFEGLKSVGQGDKIEVLTRCEEGNLFNNEYRNGSYLDDGSFYSGNNGTSNTELLYVKPNTKYSISYDNSDASAIFEFDVNKRFIKRTSSSNSFSFTTTSNTRYINFFIGTNSQGFNPLIKTIISEGDIVPYQPSQQDKKQILTTLRSLPNGVKDTIEKRGNKYYKIKRCEELVLNGNEDWVKGAATSTTISYVLNTNYGFKINGICISDKFIYEPNWNNEIEGVRLDHVSKLTIEINKTKLTTTQDLAGFKTWLSQNPVAVVYELATPIIEELPNFNPQTFSDNTTLLLNTGVVQAEASFEVTNSLGSELEVLKNKVSDLDDVPFNEVYQPTLLNGWTQQNDNYALILVRNNSNNTVNIIGRIKGGITTSGTVICKLPNLCIPKVNQNIMLNYGVSGEVLGVAYVTNGGIFALAKCSNNADVYFNATYYLN